MTLHMLIMLAIQTAVDIILQLAPWRLNYIDELLLQNVLNCFGFFNRLKKN